MSRLKTKNLLIATQSCTQVERRKYVTSFKVRMKLIGLVIKWLWWLGVLYTPAALHNLERQFMDSISCPPVGDCYVPGSKMLINFDMLIIGLAFYLWPVCIWFLGGRYAFSTVRSFVCKRLNHHASGTSNGAHYVKD